MQPIPKVSRADVGRIVERDYPPTLRRQVLEIIDSYDPAGREPQRSRVQLAALKLAAGNVNELRRHVDAASRDFRDVIASAEYPAAARQRPSSRGDETEQQHVYDADWEQYRAWLERA